jgi:hypothetical protein
MVPPIDLEAVLRNLRTSSDPRTFLARLPPITSIPDEEYFKNPAYKPLREAWAAGRFGKALELQGHTVAVKLATELERFPDFHLNCDGSEYDFEFTEALPPGRRRGDEYRDYFGKLTALRPYHSLSRKEGQDAVAAAIRRKANKFYAGKPHLLVYADFSGEGIDLRECLAQGGGDCTQFASVWILMTLWVAKLSDSGTFRAAALTAFPFERAGN